MSLDNELMNVLLGQRCKKDEIKHFDNWRYFGNECIIDLLNLVTEYIIFRYNLFPIQYNLNSKAKELILKIMESQINFYVHKKIKLLENEYQTRKPDSDEVEEENNDKNDLIEPLYRRYATDLVDKTEVNIIYILENRFIIEEVRIALVNLVYLVNMYKKYLKNRLDSERQIINYGAYSDPKYRLERKKLLDFYYKIVLRS